MCKCAIQWIDANGQATADNNDAIGLAVCYDPISFGEKGSKPFPICEHHAKQRGKYWKLIPFKNQKDIHELVTADENFKIIPDIVSSAIKNAFKYDYKEILESLKWGDDHFYFIRYGMYIGVELDGYIHS